MSQFALHTTDKATANGWTVMLIEGIVDATAARALHEELSRRPSGSVVLDFSHAALVHDAALDVVADGLRGRGEGTVLIRGLTSHQERLLAYLGLEACCFKPSTAVSEPASFFG